MPTYGGLCDRGECLKQAQIIFKVMNLVFEVCKDHRIWAISQLLEQTGGRPEAIAIAHVAFRSDIRRAKPVLVADR
jgi:hypothetical protein